MGLWCPWGPRGAGGGVYKYVVVFVVGGAPREPHGPHEPIWVHSPCCLKLFDSFVNSFYRFDVVYIRIWQLFTCFHLILYDFRSHLIYIYIVIIMLTYFEHRFWNILATVSIILTCFSKHFSCFNHHFNKFNNHFNIH